MPVTNDRIRALDFTRQTVIGHGAVKTTKMLQNSEFLQRPFGVICLNLLKTAVVKQKCIQYVKGCNYIPSTTWKSIKHWNLSVMAVVNGSRLVSHKLGWLRLQLGLANTSCRAWSEQIKARAVLSLAPKHDFPSQTWPLSRSNTPLSFSDPPCATASQISWKHGWFISIRLFSEHPQIDSLCSVWMERYISWCSK